MSVKNYILLFLIVQFANVVNGQSTSVFDANYFNKENTTPPIRVGKGFHINDIYKQTRGCFTTESCKEENLKAQQSGGKKTTIKVYHTQTNQEYNVFKRKGASGKVSFLNLFSIGGQNLEEYANKEVQDLERIIFNANVDFGTYHYTNDLALTDDAKALVASKNLNDFVKFYGTHYINGVKRESSISVILTKQSSKSDETSSTSNSLNASGTTPYKASGSFEVTDNDWINTQLFSNKFTASIEINGPSIEQSSIQGEINNIINGSSDDKVNAISKIIEGVMKNISDPKQSIITQYYYAPFDLYGLEGINWDEKKQNMLSKINEAVVDVYSSKTLLNELTTESGKNQLKQELINQGVSNDYLQKFMNKYNQALPTFQSIQAKADNYLQELEIRYAKCADVYCTDKNVCCNNDAYLAEIANYNFTKKIDDEHAKLIESMLEVAVEMNKPECEKQQKGIIRIKNFSSNPYTIYQGNKAIDVIKGNTTLTYNVNMGQYNFKAVQNSGYVLYPTENIRTANIKNVCQEITLNIGFED
jgi:hypothetical protein